MVPPILVPRLRAPSAGGEGGGEWVFSDNAARAESNWPDSGGGGGAGGGRGGGGGGAERGGGNGATSTPDAASLFPSTIACCIAEDSAAVG